MSDCTFRWITDREIRAASKRGDTMASAVCGCGRWEYYGKHAVQARRMWREDHIMPSAGVGGTR